LLRGVVPGSDIPPLPTVYISLDTAIAVGLIITSLPQNNIYFFGRTVTNLLAL